MFRTKVPLETEDKLNKSGTMFILMIENIAYQIWMESALEKEEPELEIGHEKPRSGQQETSQKLAIPYKADYFNIDSHQRITSEEKPQRTHEIKSRDIAELKIS